MQHEVQLRNVYSVNVPEILNYYMNKMAVTVLNADRQDKANSGFLVTAVSIDISQNTMSFSCIMNLASFLESIVLG